MTVEEGGVYEGSIEKLHTLYDLGVRISTLTWNFPNELGFPNPAQEEGKPYLPDLENGLTPTGIAFVEEMERLGIVIDLSHLMMPESATFCAYERSGHCVPFQCARRVLPSEKPFG